MSTPSTIAGAYYNKLFELAEQFAETASNATDGVQTAAGRLSMPISYAADLITMGEIQSTQVPVTTNRGRDETISVGMTFSAFRTGERDASAKDAMDAAFALANNVGDYVRNAITGDTTLGGTVQWCFLTQVDASALPIESSGVLWEVDAIFTAQFRVRG
jgi:hypothetical protein